MRLGWHLLALSAALAAVSLAPTRAVLLADVSRPPSTVSHPTVTTTGDTTQKSKRPDSSNGSSRSRVPGKAVRSGSGGEVVSSSTRTARITHVRRQWSVQVAGYETLDAAEAMQSSLKAKGYDARIVGAQRPFDVRVGRYRSSDSALKIAWRLRRIGSTVFVTPAEPLPPAIAKRVKPAAPRGTLAVKGTTRAPPTSSPRAPLR